VQHLRDLCISAHQRKRPYLTPLRLLALFIALVPQLRSCLMLTASNYHQFFIFTKYFKALAMISINKLTPFKH